VIERLEPVPLLRETPRHVAIIMDGNRRWARERGMPSIEGHRIGARRLREIARAAADAGIGILTVYAFSEENWQRSPTEVRLLMELVGLYARSEQAALVKENVRVRVIGRMDRLPQGTRRALEALVAATAGNDRLHLNLAIDYSARTELCDAVRALAADVAAGKLDASKVTEKEISGYLYTAGQPDPDLLIRTGGELRLSNFLLYQVAYTELWSTQTHWPDFDAKLLYRAIGEFTKRERRYGT
jgi:undecaprenyl diphosphate synthase